MENKRSGSCKGKIRECVWKCKEIQVKRELINEEKFAPVEKSCQSSSSDQGHMQSKGEKNVKKKWNKSKQGQRDKKKKKICKKNIRLTQLLYIALLPKQQKILKERGTDLQESLLGNKSFQQEPFFFLCVYDKKKNLKENLLKNKK